MMVKTSAKSQKGKLKMENMHGNTLVKKIAREFLPLFQLIFVLGYATVALIKWNNL